MMSFFCARQSDFFWNAVITGVSLNDDETENTQGSRYCLVAIGRLQVFLEFLFCWTEK